MCVCVYLLSYMVRCSVVMWVWYCIYITCITHTQSIHSLSHSVYTCVWFYMRQIVATFVCVKVTLVDMLPMIPVCVCVYFVCLCSGLCVCVREMEREREEKKEKKTEIICYCYFMNPLLGLLCSLSRLVCLFLSLNCSFSPASPPFLFQISLSLTLPCSLSPSPPPLHPRTAVEGHRRGINMPKTKNL